ncbi:unnamed protein product [Ilex paraguariensis]|uniref:Uncharacterized protein n=1 Tax=Ilex paraguariensis TaxID=185542 RepID=A0ABC8TKE0_9AQUA
MSTMSRTLNLCGVLSESKRIINAHSRHFLSLSVLFLLPLSFSFFIYPTLQSTLFQGDIDYTQFLLRLSSDLHYPPSKTLILYLIYAFFVVFLSLCASATITYSTFHGFYGRPVKFMSAIKSLFHSFVPLMITMVVSKTIAVLMCLIFGLYVVLVYRGLQILGFEIDYNSSYFIGFCVIVAILLGLVLIWLHVNWALASVIVVVESKWGIEPLRRSFYLLNGMRWVSLSLLLYFGCLIGLLTWGTMPAVYYDGVSGWRSWLFILQTVVGSSFVTLLMLHVVAAHAVLYMYCKALHGELAFDIAEEFAHEYVSLPFDDEKASVRRTYKKEMVVARRTRVHYVTRTQLRPLCHGRPELIAGLVIQSQQLAVKFHPATRRRLLRETL